MTLSLGLNKIMLPLQSLDSQSYEEIRDQLLAQLKNRCPNWPVEDAADPARVFVELFSWLSEQSQFRLGQRSDDDIESFLDSFGKRTPVASGITLQQKKSRPRASHRPVSERR